MNENIGQKSSVWDDWWGGITPLSEIQMWDFYGGRQWVAKYTPRYGKVIEGGCGVGRYVFYLRRMGIEVEGVDFSDAVIEKLKIVKNEIEPTAVFKKGDVTNLPYNDNSLSGYLSFGVVEHFIEGPQKPIAEAFRALRPGGIAIITTPNISFLILYRNLKKQLKNVIKKIIGKTIIVPPFFQYEYRPSKLKKY